MDQGARGRDALINLAGRSVDCRYTASNRREIMISRLESTRVLREAIERAAVPPRVWLQSSTATINADNYGAAYDVTGVLGGDEPGLPDTWRFSLDVARLGGGGAGASAVVPAAATSTSRGPRRGLREPSEARPLLNARV